MASHHHLKANAVLRKTGYKGIAATRKHPDAPQDAALIRKMVESSALKRARGGGIPGPKKPHVPKKAGVHVNVLVAPQGDRAPRVPGAGMGMARPPMPPPRPPAAPMGPRPPMAPGMGTPGMGAPMGGMPMRRPMAPGMMKKGGRVVPMTAGAGGGEGRREKVDIYGGKRG